MDALKLMKRLRAERKALAEIVTAPMTVDRATVPVRETNQGTKGALAAAAPVSLDGTDRDLWRDEALLARTWSIGGRELTFLEDPMGRFAAGNGATLWCVNAT